MNKVIIVSYYTENTPYEEIINLCLKPSLDKHGLLYDIHGVPDRKNWYANTAYKATFMEDMLNEHKCDCVFIDADAVIDKVPVLFYTLPEEYDMAVHYLDWGMFWHGRLDCKRRDLLSGTMLMRYNQKMMKIVAEWKKAVASTTTWEQKVLQAIVEKHKELKIFKLPMSYTSIVKPDGSIPNYEGQPVITHYQASRKYRK